ncbi:MAG TPA: hypothetical protein VK771_08695 [Acidimicrobiia bacterium]|jgi:hypothetical protein|nr:hypothetical protein [Acidimicrobiia bacterium]
MTGNTYKIPPQPPVAANTRVFEAGAVTFGVEYRNLDPESLRATYAENDEQLAELEERSPEGGFFDAGVSIHVCGTDDGYEYLRFDLFDDEPHYHYVHRHDDGTIENQVIDFDPIANGDMLAWAMSRMRSRLPEMLSAAGGDRLVDQIDMTRIGPALDHVTQIAEAARRARA